MINVAKVGYTGEWSKYTEPVTQDITVEAVYTINQYKVTFTANGTIVKTMTVDYGYILKTSDYPAVPIVNGKTGQWTRYTKPITRNITITATYSDAGINPPVKPPIETSSIDGAASNNGKVKEIITARHTYIYTGGQLAQETITTTITPADGTSTPTGDIMSSGESSATATLSGKIGSTTTTGNNITTEILYYTYDANGVPMSLTYTDAQGTTTTYYYATNIQGDVTAILDTTGTAVVEYTYDAWGNPLTITGTLADTLGKLNSLRYRSYVYDTETELYYLQSRYYNPKTGRFINADGYTSTGQRLIGNNMLAYCLNNPVVYVDETGEMCVLMKLDGGSTPQSPPVYTPYSSVYDNKYDVYIVGENEVDAARKAAAANSGNATYVIVADLRADTSNPNMRIYNSYLITDQDAQKAILEALVKYNSEFPTDPAWTREVDEMLVEWDYHNLAAKYGIQVSSSYDVDLDENDKDKGLLKKGWEIICDKIGNIWPF